MAKQWYMEWVVADWLGDPAVSLLKPATRGIWKDAIDVMHQVDQSGRLEGTVNDLARLCRCTPTEMRAAIDDLKQRNAADVTERRDGVTTVVTLVNRRMSRLWRDRKSASTRKQRQRHRDRHGSDPPGVTEGVTDTLNRNLIPKDPPNPPAGGGGGRVNGEAPPEFWELFPPEMATPDVRAAWSDWLQHRRERKPRVTPMAARQQVAKLSSLGPRRAVDALRHSISGGYQGIFEPSGGLFSGGRNGAAPGGGPVPRPAATVREDN